MNAILTKMAAAGPPLGEQYAVWRGLETGGDAVWVVDRRTRDVLAGRDARTAALFKPWLAVQDLGPWRVRPRGLWVIDVTPDVDLQDYPAVLDYMCTFRAQLTRRRPDASPWYAIPGHSTALRDALAQPKVLYPALTGGPRCVWDGAGVYVAHAVCFIPRAGRYVQGLLGSQSAWYYLRHRATGHAGRYAMTPDVLAHLPLPVATVVEQDTIATLATQLETAQAETLALEAELNARVAALYGLTTEDDQRVLEGLQPIAGGKPTKV